MTRKRLSILLAAALMLLLPASAFAVRAGDLDKTFNAPKGYAMKNLAFKRTSNSASTIQSDGKVVMVGHNSILSSFSNSSAFVIRFNRDGSVDKGFGLNGFVRFDDAMVFDIAVQPDGKLIIVGAVSVGFQIPGILITRLNSNGSRDTSFGTNGYVTTDIGSDSVGTAVALQQDGKIIIGGYHGRNNSDLLVVRLNFDGSPDPTFGDNGFSTYDLGADDYLNAIAVQADGRITAVGSTGQYSRDLLIVRFNSNGSFDNAFGNSGIFIFDSGTSDAGSDIILQQNGQIIVTGGSETSNGSNDYKALIIRLNSNGTFDRRFGTGGIATFHYGGLMAIVCGASIQPDGKIVIATFKHSPDWQKADIFITRLNTDGTVDKGFGSDGIAVFADGYIEGLRNVKLLSDGKLLIVGKQLDTTGNTILMLRYDNNGKLDNSFSDDGIVRYIVRTGTEDHGKTTAVQSDGKIIIAGVSFSDMRNTIFIQRYNGDGTQDKDFGTNGIIYFDAGWRDKFFVLGTFVLLQADGKFILTINRGMTLTLFRFNVDGTPDISFGLNGSIDYSLFFGFNQTDLSYNLSVAIQSDRKLLVADRSLFGVVLLRLNIDGTPDNDFGTGGVTFYSINNWNNGVGMAIQSDGRIIVAGSGADNNNNNQATCVDGHLAILRFSSNGTIDSGFGNNGVIKYPNPSCLQVRDLLMRKNGKFVVLLSGISEISLKQFNSDGSSDTGFGVEGIASFDDSMAYANAMKLQRDGKIVVTGNAPYPRSNISDTLVLRFNQNGSPDKTFGDNGVAKHKIGTSSSGNALAIQPDGNIVIAGEGFNPYNHSYDSLVMRLISTTYIAPPSSLTATPNSSRGITLTWTDNSDD